MKKFLKGILITLGSIVLLVGLLIGGLNVIKFGIYHEYYSIRYALNTDGMFHMEQLFNDGWLDSGKTFKTIDGIKRNNRMYLNKIQLLGGVVDEYYNGGISN